MVESEGVDASANECECVGDAVTDRAGGSGRAVNTEVAEGRGLSMHGAPMAQSVRRARLEGLLDEPRPGRPRTITDEQVEAMITRPWSRRRRDDTHWSTRSMAAAGVVAVGGLADLAGVRAAAAPPGDLEAVDRPAVRGQGPRRRRALPRPARGRAGALRGREVADPGARPHRAGAADAARHSGAGDPRLRPPGTSSLYAALDIASGTVIGSLHARHRAIEFQRSCSKIDDEVPADFDLHLVLDNASTHKTPAVKRWLPAIPRFHLHFTPTSSSWLNLVERWFAELTTKKLRRGTHRTVRELNADIRAWINTWNDNPRPFVWTKTADQILDSRRTTANELTTQDTSAPSTARRRIASSSVRRASEREAHQG